MRQRKTWHQPAAAFLLKAWAAMRNIWRALLAEHASAYRPEAHYMRGPGPKWRAKHLSIRHNGR
jgi:hypothetical protein